MSHRTTNFQIVAPFVLSSVLLLVLCGIGAGYLYRLQALNAAELEDNVVSRRAAFNVGSTIEALIAQHSDPEKSAALRAKIPELIAEIDRLSDRPNELRLYKQIQREWQLYSNTIQDLPAPGTPQRQTAEQRAIGALREVAK